jgi:hypothetical protein
MYIINEPIKFENVGKAAKEIGVNISTLSRILHRKQKCSKILAYCITKYIEQNAEINDYFTRIGD